MVKREWQWVCNIVFRIVCYNEAIIKTTRIFHRFQLRESCPTNGSYCGGIGRIRIQSADHIPKDSYSRALEAKYVDI